MSGEWIYDAVETEQIHKCKLPPVRFTGYLPGSIWKCECGLQYVVSTKNNLIPSPCGRGICAKQGGHPGNCNF
jgi:hypothetical protein